MTMAAFSSLDQQNDTHSHMRNCFVPEGIDWLYTYQPAYMWFIFAVGFVENVFVISVFLLHKSPCTVAEIYLGNMAAADLIFVSGLPFWAIYISNKFNWPFGSFLCVTVNSLIQLNLYGSIYFLMMVSIDRYLALVKTMSFGRMRRTSCAKINCAIIWIFAVVASLPKVIFRKVLFLPEFNTTSCLIFPPDERWNIASNILMNLFGCFIPAVVIGFCTFHIIKVLRNNTMQQFKEVNNEKKATRLVFSVLLVFVVCWLPFHVITFVDTFDLFRVFHSCDWAQVLEVGNQISTYFGFSNSCLNPLLYVIVGNHFRKKAREVFRQILAKFRPPRRASLPMNYSGITVRTSISVGQQNLILKQ
ncbi:PREDICTED: B2 bradykinin receptor-like [Nanorana parkeri]|uniref:B2 bradykinin receptor-like n=1 Tax=Nanorana parkeri TaxID=125878 RepID=UPI000854E61D|nr:PREDICTED: B2 bradykinin receptor-like [Nanorana parkeri]